MAKYFKAERETKNRKFFDKPPKRGRFKGKVSWAISRAKLIHNGSSRELRKTLVFIRFDEEGTILEKEKRLKSLFFYEDYGIGKFDGYL